MKCPLDQTELNMSDRQGIEIDYCPQCRGVWLDRGELDKLIERSTQSTTPPPASPKQSYDDRSHSEYSSYGKKRKKENFLGDLFDF